MENIKVYQAINAIQADMARIGITKDNINHQQGFKFRGIDDVYLAIAPLLAKHKLVIIPRQVSRTVIERMSKSGGVLFYVVVDMEYDFISSEDGSKHTARIPGEAMDSGDKATNKACSGAYKYLCFQTFCIPTEGDNDADGHSHELQSKSAQPAQPAKPPASASALAAGQNSASEPIVSRWCTGIITFRSEPNAGGFVCYNIEGQLREDGKEMKFASKFPAILDEMDACYNKKLPVRLEYHPASKPQFSHTIEKVVPV